MSEKLIERPHICLNCKHWRPFRKNSAWGNCAQWNTVYGKNYVNILDDSEPAETHQYFGCAPLWEPKDAVSLTRIGGEGAS